MTFGLPSKKSATPRTRCTRLQLEALESRLALYSVSGNAWPTPQLITISFVPDGTNVNGQSSNLFASMNARFGSPATWQNQILKAAQQWAQQTNINFAIVSDSGAASGSGDYQQGDPGFGDIRVGGYSFGNSTLAQAYLPPPVNNYSVAGDMQFNTAQTWNIGSTYDLYTVAMHEFGHALGLYHGAAGSVMHGSYSSAKPGLATDDVNGIRSVYSGGAARAKDAYDALVPNDTSLTAQTITSAIDPATQAAVIDNLDLTTTTDVDWYKFVVPSGSTATLTVKAVSAGISLLNAKVEVYNSLLSLVGSNVAGAFGGTALASITGVLAGQTYYVKVSSTDTFSPAFKTGRYSLVLNMGTGADPAPTVASTQTPAGNPRSGGGGQAVVLDYADRLVHSPWGAARETSSNGHRTLATDGNGNFVVAWASAGQDGSGRGIYARRFDAEGQPLGGEFRVNATTAGDQTLPTIAMNAAGGFVIAWTSAGQDGSGLGVYAQRYDSAGLALGGEFRVNTTTANDQTDAAVAMDPAGGFVIAWASDGQDGSGLGVYARRFDSQGAALGEEFRVNSVTAGDQTDPSVGVDPLGNFVVAWTSAGEDGSGLGVYAQRYDAQGLVQGLPFRVNTTTANDQRDPAVVVGKDGDFAIAWASFNQDGSGWGIYAQSYASLLLGLPQGGEVLCNTTTLGDQTDPSVAVDSNGNTFLTWTSTGNNGLDVRGQQFEGLFGEQKEGELTINLTTQGDQRYATVAISAVGRAVVVWSGDLAPAATRVYFQRFDLTRDSYHAEEGPSSGLPTCASGVTANSNSASRPDSLPVRGSDFEGSYAHAFLGLIDLGNNLPATHDTRAPLRGEDLTPILEAVWVNRDEGEDDTRRGRMDCDERPDSALDDAFAGLDLAAI